MRFAGYAAVFDRTDRGGDVIRRGAFAGAGPPVPVYLQHDPARRIGTAELVAEDARGLRVIGRLDAGATVARGAGLSFGYRVKAMRAGESVGTKRELLRLELIEVSVVTHPMQPLARVHAVENSVADRPHPNPSPEGEGLSRP